MFVKESIKPLSELKVGETAVISSLSGVLRGQQRRRLLDLGIVPGTKIKAVLESIGKDPVAYEVRDTLIALRKNQSDYIFIKEVN
ncbi:MAG: FeoA family protein [Melioribacter sp.]|nr:FeoA family protein [Melioribacter sp.]